MQYIVVRDEVTPAEALRLIAGEDLPADLTVSFWACAEAQDLVDLGVSPDAAVRLVAARSLARRYKSVLPAKRPVIGGLADVQRLAGDLETLESERMILLFLDDRNRLIASELLTCPADDPGRVDFEPDRVATKARGYKASGVVMVHNHPGSPKPWPSVADDWASEQLNVALAKCEIELVDCVILGAPGTVPFSYHDTGRLC